MQFVITNSTVIPGPQTNPRTWWERLFDLIFGVMHVPLHRETYAYFYTPDAGLLIPGMVFSTCFDPSTSWLITFFDEEGFHARLTSAIPLYDFKRFNGISGKYAIAYAQAFPEKSPLKKQQNV